ncbi:toll/interleukin-1 receptor domain-containing protein [Streptomyces sp. NPDC101117]|uniref:toll/interleukin-1 receptor domain-containing protein n=1 Tax=Streptomyces sp. NPDC101117 TaxID=3366108 RepID=UPI00382DFDF3
MKVFLSWSGRRSKAMAEFLQNWLPDVIQAVDPWVSSRSISQGSRPLPNIADELSECNFGIVCVTPESRGSEWVNFEAGALSKVLEESMVVPLLLDIDKSQVTGPLSQFQMTVSTEKEEMFKLVTDMNKRLGDSALVPDRLIRSFEQNWPELQEELKKITSLKGETKAEQRQKRPVDDLLDEVLLLARRQEIRLSTLEKTIDSLRIDNAGGGRFARTSRIEPRDTGGDPDVPSEVKMSDADTRKAKEAFARLRLYGVLGVRIMGDRVTVNVKEFPESDSAAIAEFRDAVSGLANEISCSVSVKSTSGNSYRHDWPF